MLRLYRDPDSLVDRLPTLRALTRSADEIKDVTARVMPAMADALEGFANVIQTACESQIGSGALPTRKIASTGLATSSRLSALVQKKKT